MKALGALGHNVKSVAAYIGAHELAAAAARVEKAERENRTDDMPACVKDFRHYLSIVLDGITAHFSGASIAHPEVPFDAAALAGLLDRAKPLVREGCFDAAAILQEIHSRLAGTALEAQARALCDQFEDVELEAASATLEQLRADLSRMGIFRP